MNTFTATSSIKTIFLIALTILLMAQSTEAKGFRIPKFHIGGGICRSKASGACSDRKSRNCDEGRNRLGPNRCSANEDCVAGRSCSGAGWCQGTQSVKFNNC